MPITVIDAGGCVVTQKKAVGNDGYSAIQVGIGEKSEKRVNKAMKVTSPRPESPASTRCRSLRAKILTIIRPDRR